MRDASMAPTVDASDGPDIVRFYRGGGTNAPEIATAGRVETMILGVLLTSIGTLVFILGLTGAICTALGIA